MNFPELSGASRIAIDIETHDPHLKTHGPSVRRGGRIVGLAVGVDEQQWYFAFGHPEGNNCEESAVREWARTELCRASQAKVGANLIYDLDYLHEWGVPVNGRFLDVQVAEPLINENQYSYSLDTLAQKYLGEGKETDGMYAYAARVFGGKPDKSQAANIWRCPGTIVAPYAKADVRLPLEILVQQERVLHEQGVDTCFDLETRLIPVLLAMRRRGVRIDRERAGTLDTEFTQRYHYLLNQMRLMARGPVDIWANASIAEAFDRLGLPFTRTRTGKPSFTRAWLEGHPHPLCKLIVEARALDKLVGTFIRSAILEHATASDRIHCQFNQLKGDEYGTVTGRLCVHATTKILTLRGDVKIVDLVPGKDHVLSHENQWQPVLRRFYKGREKMYTVFLSNGHSLTCTGKHRVLAEDGSWRHVDEYFDEAPDGSCTLRTCGEQVSGEGQANNQGRGSGVRDNAAHGAGDAEAGTFGGATEAGAAAAALASEGRREESDEREVSGAASQLEGGVLGCQGVHDDTAPELVDRQGKARVPAPRGNGSGAGAERTSEELDGASRGREQAEQSRRQSGLDDQQRPLPPACLAGGAHIVGVEVYGVADVFDIEVADDHSYKAAGIWHHNSSSNPNLQQVPARSELGKLIREVFLPEPGQQWAKYDYAQIEPRITLHYADPNMRVVQRMVQAYWDDPTLDCYNLMLESMSGVTRNAVKAIYLGMTYGMGKPKLAAQLGIAIDEAQDLFDRFHTGAPYVRALNNKATNKAATSGHIYTLSGRRRRFDHWEPARWRSAGGVEVEKEIVPVLYDEACERWGETNVRRAYTYRALNALIQGSAADVMKRAMVDAYERGCFDAIGVPMLTVHDELDMSFDAGNAEHMAALAEVRNCMENAYRLRVPLHVDVETGDNWGNVK